MKIVKYQYHIKRNLFFEVHTAASRVSEALENWLQLEKNTLTPSIIRNAYLHFEALTDHTYDFACVLCGYNPTALVLYANKKGAFDLTGIAFLAI